MYFFVRVNGDTSHNNPNDAACFVPGEPPVFPTTYFNYLGFCFKKNIVRIGWPDTGDLRVTLRVATPKTGALAACYSLATIPPYVRTYLAAFRSIPVGSIILVPDKGHPGDLYICTVTDGYYYFHNVPTDPYECAHRLKVAWDRDNNGQPIMYPARRLGIDIHGGFFRRAFHEFRAGNPIINNINTARAQVGIV